MLDTCVCTHPTKRVSLVFHVDDLLLARTRQMVTEILSELRGDLELKSSEVTTKPTLPGTNPCKNKGRVLTLESEASCVQDMLEEFNMSALESTLALRWDCRETDEVGPPANEQKVYRHLVGKLLRIGGKGFIKFWSGERHGREKHQVNPVIPP